MDGSRFDQLARSRVTRTDRRRALRGVLATGLLGASWTLYARPAAAAPECQTSNDCRGNRLCDTTTARPWRCQPCRKESTACTYGVPGQSQCCDNATETCDGGSDGTGCVPKPVTCAGDGVACTSDTDCCQAPDRLFCSCCTGLCIHYGVQGSMACCTDTSQCQQNEGGSVECHNIDPATGRGVCCVPGSAGCVLSETCQS